MKPRRYFVTTVVCLLNLIFLGGLVSAVAAPAAKYPLTPKTHQGQKWRIAYYEGGPYANYPSNLKALVDALADLGWATKPELQLPRDRTDTTAMWQFLARNLKSDYLEFVADAYWSGDWTADLREKNQQAALKRLSQTKDIDLVIAMGTWAGQDLASDTHTVPVVVISSSNPLEAGIIKSSTDSGLDHVNARVDPKRYARQLAIFHDIFSFQKLGICYDQETLAGKSYAAIEDVHQVAKERGFEVVSCHAPSANTKRRVAKAAVLECYQQLAGQADAVYVTLHRGVTLENLPQLLAPLTAKKLPTFSQFGSDEVRHGVLLSIAQAGFKYVARFHAETLAQIFNGAKPRDLAQLFEDPPRIALNLKTAAQIGWEPTVDILGSADEIYETIEVFRAPAK